MSFLVYDLEQNNVVARYNDRQDAERVCEAFNTINEVNRRNSNTVSVFSRRYIIIDNGNTSANVAVGVAPTITFSTSAGAGGNIGNNWFNYIGNNAIYPS